MLVPSLFFNSLTPLKVKLLRDMIFIHRIAYVLFFISSFILRIRWGGYYAMPMQ